MKSFLHTKRPLITPLLVSTEEGALLREIAPHLDGQYAGFGRVIEGEEVIDAIANVKTGNYGWYMQDVPVTAIVIEKMEIVGA